MAHQTVKETTVLLGGAEQDSTRIELERLGTVLEQYRSEIKQKEAENKKLEEYAAQLGPVVTSVKEKEIEAKNLKLDIKELQKNKDELLQIKKEVAAQTTLKSLVESEIEKLKVREQKLTEEVAKLQAIVQATEMAKIRQKEAKEQMEIVQSKLETSKSELETFLLNFEKEKKEKETLKIGLDNQLKIQQENLLLLDAEAVEKTKALKEKIAQVEAELEKKKIDFETQQNNLKNKLDAEAKIKNDSLIAREGECLKRELRANDRLKDLIQLKADLEKHYNRSFPNIILTPLE